MAAKSRPRLQLSGFCISSPSARSKWLVNAVTNRSESCPCGSGEKFKECCRNKPKPQMKPSQGPPPEVIAKAVLEIQRKRLAQQEWTAKYGDVRPCIHADNWGKKFVATGKRILWSETWKFIPDFLLDYVPGLFGKDWWDAEVAKPELDRHQVFQWRTGCLRHLQTGQRAPDGKRMVEADGKSAAYLALAFNLFAIEDNGRLDDTLLQRLRHPDQFQGAWHEVEFLLKPRASTDPVCLDSRALVSLMRN